MLGWIADRIWAWKNRHVLDHLDREMEALDAKQLDLSRVMAEMYGPDWRRQAEERLERLSSVYWR